MKDNQIKLEGDAQDRAQLAENLVTWRLRNGYTQRQVAASWGVSRYTLMRAEAAHYVAWPMLYRLSAKLTDELRKEGKNE